MTPTAALPAASRTARLNGRVVSRHAVDARTREQMFSLLSAHFDGVDRETFDRDLAEKSLAILLEDDTGVLRGFSTMLVYDTTVRGRAITVIYSGDTIVERAWWGSPVLARTWIAAALGAASDGEPREVYWLLLTSGFRTYRFLSVFFREFHPRFDTADAGEDPALLDALARERFADRYDPVAGVVRFARPQVLAADLVELPAGRMPDPHVAYFLARNPGFVNGDELVCLTRIDVRNLTPAGRRMAAPAER